MDRDRNKPAGALEKLRAMKAAGVDPVAIAVVVPVKRKRGRPPKVKVDEPEIIDPAEDAVWITYDADDPDMVLLQPFMRVGQVMVNPAKAGSYHCRMPAAKAIIAKLGADWAIEGMAIVRRLRYELKCEWSEHPATNEAFQKDLRHHLLGMAKGPAEGLLGIHLVREGLLIAEKRKGWLYVTWPKTSTCKQTAGTFLRTHLNGEAFKLAGPFKRGILDDSGSVEFASYTEQTINVRMYISEPTYASKVIYTAIKNGAQFAMKHVAKDIPLDEFLEAEVAAAQGTRDAEVKKAQEAILNGEGQVMARVAQLREAQQQVDKARKDLARVERKTTKGTLLKEYPALANVASINDDDPAVTVVTTKDIILNGVNLGPYKIKVNPGIAMVVIAGKAVPKGLTHPKLYEDGGKWKWDITEADLAKVLGALSVNRLSEAFNIIIETLITIDLKNEGQVARLKQIEDYMKEPKA